ncbi:MAG: hypothetical protein K6G34_03790 [Lachnospiraceae bacterium]|nr:hypothetical protein [Lachnospiraceae bacterium]
MKKRIYLFLLSLILVFSLLPASGVFAKELYDHPIVSPKKAASSQNDQSGNTGSSAVTSPKWVLVDKSHTIANDIHNAYYNIEYSFKGESDGTVRFKRSGGYFQDARNYARCDVYYECIDPPSVLTPGQPINITMKTTVENYEFSSTSGSKPGVYSDTAWVQDAAHFKDVRDKNNTYLFLTVTGNTSASGEFAGTASTWNVIGSHYEIKFCISNTGTFTWTYELQNVPENYSIEEAQTSAGEAQTSAAITGPRWVLVNKSHTIANDIHNAYYNIEYSFEGESDGTVRFKRSGGFFQDARNYALCDVYYECIDPPSVLAPGQPINITMKTTVENYEFASTSGSKPGVYSDTAWVQDAAHFKDVRDKNNTYLFLTVTGNTSATGEFAGIASTWNVIGSHYEIKFCISNTGTYTWTYELQDK